VTPDAFRAALRRLGLTQADLCRAFGVSERAVSYWTSERDTPEPVARLLWACERDRGLLEALLQDDAMERSNGGG
jgi:transcriptional regulator with XRE-family HTH domain